MAIYVHSVDRRWWSDLGLAAVLTTAAQAQIRTGHLDHPLAAALTTGALTGGLALRRRFPVVVGGMALTILSLHLLVVGDVESASLAVLIAIMVATFSLGAYGAPREAVSVGLAGLVSLAAVAVVKSKPVGDLLFVAVIMFTPWLAGLELHRRGRRLTQLERHAADLDQQAEQRARAAVGEERTRIARELHDVVAHAMSVIVVQAGAERHVLPDEQAATRAVLETIERTGRQALGEMRRLLGMMRSEDNELALAPQPSLDHLPDLCEQVRAAGLPVELEVSGAVGPIPPGIDVSAYRIVQEALTNALKHAGPARARVRVCYQPQHLAIEIDDDGRGAHGAAHDVGHGLVGMRERVTVYGGELEAGNRSEGSGYAIRVRLPFNQASG